MKHSPGAIPVLGWPLAALRVGMLLAFLPACVLLYYIVAPFSRRNPVPHLFLSCAASICGLRIRRSGVVARGGTVILANHVSWLDIPALAKATGTAFVAHDGLAAAAPIRWLCRLNGTVFVARHNRKSVAAQVAQVREAIRETGTLAIFPEGTTDDGSSRLPFKSSLLSALDPLPPGIAVQPVLLDYGRDVREIAWVDNEPGKHNALRILARLRPVHVDIRVLPPLSGDALGSRKAMAAAARAAIEKAREDAAN